VVIDILAIYQNLAWSLPGCPTHYLLEFSMLEFTICSICHILYKFNKYAYTRTCSVRCSTKARSKKLRGYYNDMVNSRIVEYNLNPKSCVQCQKILPYEKKHLKFCDSSCAATFNNTGKVHSVESRLKRSKTSRLKINTNSKHQINIRFQESIVGEYTPVYRNICAETGKIFYSKTYQKYSSEAIYNNRKIYRLKSDFNFNVYDFPDIFDVDLLYKYSWYHPERNPTGISRDHMFSVADGWLTKVDTNILNHPANCRLVFHIDNQRKNTKSIITLDELKTRIENWGC
jgi:hypothetical protein